MFAPDGLLRRLDFSSSDVSVVHDGFSQDLGGLERALVKEQKPEHRVERVICAECSMYGGKFRLRCLPEIQVPQCRQVPKWSNPSNQLREDAGIRVSVRHVARLRFGDNSQP